MLGAERPRPTLERLVSRKTHRIENGWTRSHRGVRELQPWMMAPLKPEEDKGLWKPLLLFPELSWGFHDEKATVSSWPSRFPWLPRASSHPVRMDEKKCP